MVNAPRRFRFGGRLSLDLTWTLAYRHWAPSDQLTSDADVTKWLATAGAVETTVIADGILEDTRDLREAIYRCAQRRMSSAPMADADVAILNRWAAQPSLYPELTAAGATRWLADDPVHAGLTAVARDGVQLLGRPTDRLRECTREGCALLFLDTSPAGRRRWCSAETCGNAVNTARYRHKTARAHRWDDPSRRP